MIRRRFRLVVGLLAVFGAVSVAAWLLWHSLSAPQIAQPGLTLLVNMRPHIEVTPGTPLVFELSLGSSPSSAGMDIGSRWRPWHRLMRLEATYDGVATPMPSTHVGTPRSMHVAPDRDGRPRVTQDTSNVAHLEGGRDVHTATFTAGPEETAGIRPGIYRIRGVLETPFWLRWGWRGRVASAAATIVVLDGSQAGDKGQYLETERLALAAVYYMDADRFVDANQMATLLISLKPNEWRSHLLLGDAAAGLGRHQEALGAYRHAMALLPPSYEEPTLLMERIWQLDEASSQSEAEQ